MKRTLAIWAVLAAGAGWFALNSIPPQDKPWQPLSLEAPIGRATSLKLRQLNENPAECSSALATATGLTTRPGATGTQKCSLRDALTIEQSGLIYGRELAASCALASALYVWEREVVAPAAARHLKSAVTRIDTAGTFSCRNVYGGATSGPSEHATANAIDVTGFRLTDGQRVTVLAHWGKGTPEARFLRDVRDGSCRLFGAVLGPEYNAAHRDHLHLDMSSFSICS